jgi:mono/diheme cytochrome c family protein
MLRKVVKVVLGLCALVILAVASCVGYFAAKWPPSFPGMPLPSITASTDPAVIARGRYLADAVAHCGACHSPMETYTASVPGQPPVLAGGHVWHMGPLGTIRSANITPDATTGVGGWSDAELARAIRHGVGRDGSPELFMMGVGPMSDEDLTAIVSYLRSIEPVSNAIPPHEIGLMGKIMFQTVMGFFAEPHDYAAWSPAFVPEGSASVERGAYLAVGPANCVGCHTPYAYEGELEFTGPYLSGGNNPFPDETDEGMEFASPNLTPDPKTGHITAWTREQFFDRFRDQGRIHPGSPMPWESYRNLTDADLESIWLYLRSLPPSENLVGPPRRERGWKPPA